MSKIINGKFKVWEKDSGIALGWKAEGSAKPFKSRNAHSGSYCQGWKGEKGGGISQKIKVKPDTYYVITLWTRFDGPGDGMRKDWDYLADAIRHEIRGSKNELLCAVCGSSVNWFKFNLYFTTGKKEKEVFYKCIQTRKRTYFLDDIKISKGTKENVAVSNVNISKIYVPKKEPSLTEWTNLVKLPNGDLVLTFLELVPKGGYPNLPSSYEGCKWFIDDEQGAKSRKKYNCEYFRRMLKSTDNGKTWKKIDYSFDIIKNMGTAYRIPIDGREAFFGDRKKVLRLGKDGIYSSKDCIKWEMEIPIDFDKMNFWVNYDGQVMVLKNGTIIVFYAGYDKINPVITTEILWSGVAYITKDRGKNWEEIVVAPFVKKWKKGFKNFDEITGVELSNGSVLFILRADVPYEYNFHQSILSKKGGKWMVSKVKETPFNPVMFNGHPNLLKLKSGIIICTGAAQQFMFSTDNAKTWQMRNLSLGGRRGHYPRMTEVGNGKVLSIYHMGADWPYPPPEKQWIQCTSFDVKKR